MSPGSTGAPVEVACKLDLSFSLSEAMTDTRPVRFLIVKRTFPPVLNSFSYDCARDGSGARQSKIRRAVMSAKSDFDFEANAVLRNIATDLACARMQRSS